MKKICLLFMCVVCLCSLSSYANGQYTRNYQMQQKPACEKPCKPNPCEKECPTPCPSSCFLCTNANMNTLFKQMNLCDTQICNAMKIQGKYEQEVLSLNERIECEEENLCRLEETCAKYSDIRKQKSLIKKLEKKKKEICECYEKQFKATLSQDQQRLYNKYKKCK